MRNKQPKPKPENASLTTARPVVDALEAAIAAVRDLSARRLEQHLSVARLMGVARELKELVKVMSIYGA